MQHTQLFSRLAGERLIALGHCDLEGRTLVLVGPDEPAFWDHFTASEEYHDRQADPLDRWSRRVLDGIAADTGAEAIYPFGGPPYRPFQTWAVQTGRFWPSPIGFLVHDTVGLFVSFRGALLLSEHWPAAPAQNPCLSCAAQPCKSACPVDAFADGYDVGACKAHICAPAGADCLTAGCRARRSCPIGQGNRLPAQATFHMKAFL